MNFERIKKELSKQLTLIAKKIETGNCELTEEQMVNIFSVISTEVMSKEQACSFLNISRSKFDSLVHEGKLPKGRKVSGFKELFWNKNDLILAVEDMRDE